MKLISCYIEGYGALRKKTVRFDERLTSFCEENGYGKTTLASFLKAMFYGMESDRANSKEFGSRRRFNPFDGGLYGGNAVFSLDGAIYKIERFFDEKSEVKDSLKVYRNNEIYTGFGEDVGGKIFGIDRQSFERTVFINSEEIEISSTGSINARLNNFIEGADDDTNTEKALERLEKLAKEYKKSRAGSDLITRENNALNEINAKTDNIGRIKEKLSEKYARLDAYDAEYRELQRRLASAQNTELALKDWERYDAFVESARENEKIMNGIAEKYPHGIPTEADVEALRNAVSARRTLADQTGGLLSAEDEQKLKGLAAMFADGVPADAELKRADLAIAQAAGLNAAISSAEAEKPSEYEVRLRERFCGREPTKETLAAADDALETYKKAERAYRLTPDYVIEQTADNTGGARRKGAKKYVAAAAASCLIAAIGIGMIFFRPAAGIILAVIGAIGLIGTGFAYLNKKAGAGAAASVQKINPEKAVIERETNEAALAVRRILAAYGYPADGEVVYSVEKFTSDYNAYLALKRSESEKIRAAEEKKTALAAIRAELEGFFAGYGIGGGDFEAMAAELRGRMSEYSTLYNTRKKLGESNSDRDRSMAATDERIKAICAKYGLDAAAAEDGTAAIAADLSAYNRAKRAYADYLGKAKKFAEEKKLAERPLPADDTDGIRKQMADTGRERSALGIEIADDECEVEKLDDLINEKQRHTELLNEYRHNYFILTRTAEMLKAAEKRLKDRYVAPIKNNFLQYAGLLEKAIGEKAVMTPDFGIRYERNGAERSEKHLSAGQRSICAFCFRMALIENMYTEEKPFLILDDPFVSLDKRHMDKVKSMLCALSEKFQIIYFTCHESRAV